MNDTSMPLMSRLWPALRYSLTRTVHYGIVLCVGVGIALVNTSGTVTAAFLLLVILASAVFAGLDVLVHFIIHVRDSEQGPPHFLETFPFRHYSPKVDKKSLDLIESQGMKVVAYFPSLDIANEPLRDVLDTVRDAGLFVIDQDEHRLIGKIATVRPDSKERVRQRRAQIRVID